MLCDVAQPNLDFVLLTRDQFRNLVFKRDLDEIKIRT